MSETVVAYHGTSERLARQIEQDGFEQSAAAGDWLGHGIYFWQDSLNWAKEWADGRKAHQKRSGKIAVIGAPIYTLGHIQINVLDPKVIVQQWLITESLEPKSWKWGNP